MKQCYLIILLMLLVSILFLVSCGDDGSVNLPSTTNPTPGSNTSSISGTVYGTDGVAIDGITVRLTPAGKITGSESYGEVQTFTTSGGGNYSFSVCYGGIYLLEALNGGTLLDSQECNISLGVNINVILGTPSNGGSLKVKVTEDGSTPIEGAALSLTDTLETSDYIEASYYYSEGWYIFENLFLQDYELTVNVDGYETYTDTVTIGATTPPVEEVVTLTAIPAPTITDFSPSGASAGIVVTIEGTNFSSEYSENTVSFNGVEGTVISAGPTEIRAAVPEGAATGPITVTTPGGTASSDSNLVVVEMTLINGGQQFGVVDCANDPNASYQVILSPYYMGKFEVTNGEYVEFLNDVGNLEEPAGTAWVDIVIDDYCGIEGSGPYTVKSGYENRPVVYITWYGAAAYCNWLSGKHGFEKCYGELGDRGVVDITKNGYRLPTEAEWEYACRGGDETLPDFYKDFYWGENYNNPAGAPFDIDNYCWYCYNPQCNSNHHDVGTLGANPCGLYDMSGNVYEWCSDRWEYSYPSGIYTDPVGPVSGTNYVIRGGCWYFTSEGCMSSIRAYDHPSSNYSFYGFRLCKTYY